MVKKDLIAKVAEATGNTKVATTPFVDAVFDCIGNSLIDGEEISIFGFGKFSTAIRAEHEGINPATQERIVIPETKSVKFKAATALKDAVNQ